MTVFASMNNSCSICDSDTPKNCSNKRISKAVAKSIEFLDKCLEMRAQEEVKIFGTLQGGFDAQVKYIRPC